MAKLGVNETKNLFDMIRHSVPNMELVNKVLGLGINRDTEIIAPRQVLGVWADVPVTVDYFCCGASRAPYLLRRSQVDKYWAMFLIAEVLGEDCPWYDIHVYWDNRTPGSIYQITANNMVDIWELASLIPDRDEALRLIFSEVDQTAQSDYYMMVIRSCLEAERNGISYQDVLPYTHSVYITGGGHTQCDDTAPYWMYRVYGQSGISASEVMNYHSAEQIGQYAKVISESEWYSLVSGALPDIGGCELEYLASLGIKFKSLLGLIVFYNETVKYDNRLSKSGSYHRLGWSETYRLSRLQHEVLAHQCENIMPKGKRERIDKITELFSHKGRVPGCVNQLADIKLSAQDIVNQFNYKLINAYKDLGLPIHLAIKASYNLGQKGLSLSARLIRRLLIKSTNDDLVNWVIAHRQSDEHLLLSVITNVQLYDLSKPFSVIKQRHKMLTSPAYKDWALITENHSIYNHIPVVSAEAEGLRATLLDLDNEVEQVEACGLGYATYCCQHINGAGETAMLYSLAHGTFWKAETDDGKLLAQAACWIHDGKFVFDNIEFTNDRDPKCIIPVLQEWCKCSPYSEIYMGTGYNELSYGKDRFEFDEVGLELPYDNEIGHIYTDAHYVICLKKGGVVWDVA